MFGGYKQGVLWECESSEYQQEIQHYYHYMLPNDKLPSLKRFFSRAKQQSAGCKWNFQPAIWFYNNLSIWNTFVQIIWPCVLIIVTHNHMTFFRHNFIVYLCPSWHHLHPHSAQAQMMLLVRATNKLYTLQKSCDCSHYTIGTSKAWSVSNSSLTATTQESPPTSINFCCLQAEPCYMFLSIFCDE